MNNKIRRTLLALPLALPLLGCPSNGQNAQTTRDSETTGQGSTVSAPPFSADSAFAYLKRQVAFGPRVPGTPGHAAQLAWMTDFLRQRADTVILQRFTHTHTKTGQKLALVNVFARFNPAATQRILLLAHWDTRPTADSEDTEEKRAQPIPGANDGASGVAVLLEIANVLKKQRPDVGVDLLFTDGEDVGPESGDMYLGATYFAANMPGYKPLYGILIDMIGDLNPVYPMEGNSQDGAPEVIDRIWRIAEELGYKNEFPRRQGGYITDDHVPLNKAGIRTIDIIDFDYAHWHKLTDDLVNVGPRGLEVVGKVLLTAVYRGG